MICYADDEAKYVSTAELLLYLGGVLKDSGFLNEKGVDVILTIGNLSIL